MSRRRTDMARSFRSCWSACPEGTSTFGRGAPAVPCRDRCDDRRMTGTMRSVARSGLRADSGSSRPASLPRPSRMPPSRIEPRPRRIAPLGRRLLLLVGAAIVPVALMSGFALHALWTQQKVQIRQSTVDLARALATSLDTELRLTVSALQTMALSPLLDAGDAQRLAQVRTLASQVLASRPEWRAVILARPSGEAIFATPALPGGELPTLVERDSFMEAVAQRRPTVGSLMIGPSGAAGIPVRVPVLRDGELRYILTAVVQPQAIVRLIGQQRIPDAWVVSVFDAKGERVARSRDQKRYFRSHASPSLQRLIAKMGSDAEIVGATTTLEGQDVYTAVSRLGVAPWTVALGEPTEIAGKAL